MMKQLDRIACGVLAGLALTALTLGATQAATQPRIGGTLNVGFVEDAKTLDPTFSVQWSERQVLYLVYNTLLRMQPDFSLTPELAESWEIQEDGKRVVFKLREGVKFHDGTDFNAEAVKFNLDRRMDEAVGSPQRKQLAGVISKVEVVDDHTVAVITETPFAPLLSYLAERPGFMISPAAAEKYGEDFGSNPVGTGPFVFKEWTRGSRIVVEQNPDYWEEGLPYLDGVVLSDMGGSVVGMQRLMTAELDYIDSLTPQDLQLLEGADGIELAQIIVGRWYSYQWQWDKPPFDNAKLRKAIAHAIDRDRLNEVTMRGQARLSNGPTPTGLWWHADGLVGYDYDPEMARKLIAEAGAKGMEIGLATPENQVLRQLNQLVQEQLNEVGLKVELKPVAQSEWYSRVVERAINFTPMRWTQRPDPDGLLSILFHSGGFANSTGYSNPEVDRLLEKARMTFDQPQRKELYDQAHGLILEDLPYVPIYFAAEFAAMRDRVMGFQWTPDQVPRFYNVWLAQ